MSVPVTTDFHPKVRQLLTKFSIDGLVGFQPFRSQQAEFNGKHWVQRRQEARNDYVRFREASLDRGTAAMSDGADSPLL